MDSSNTALRRKNDEAAERELRYLRVDTIEGLRYALSLGDDEPEGVALFRAMTLRDAITVIEERWPA